jgi:hypothetical protein
MYNSRITQWGFDKNKSSDIEIVLRKKMHRDALQKNTVFTVRGRSLSMEAFSRYVKCHYLLEKINREQPSANTPEHISYQTRLRLLVHKPNEMMHDLIKSTGHWNRTPQIQQDYRR